MARPAQRCRDTARFTTSFLRDGRRGKYLLQVLKEDGAERRRQVVGLDEAGACRQGNLLERRTARTIGDGQDVGARPAAGHTQVEGTVRLDIDVDGVPP